MLEWLPCLWRDNSKPFVYKNSLNKNLARIFRSNVQIFGISNSDIIFSLLATFGAGIENLGGERYSWSSCTGFESTKSNFYKRSFLKWICLLCSRRHFCGPQLQTCLKICSCFFNFSNPVSLKTPIEQNIFLQYILLKPLLHCICELFCKSTRWIWFLVSTVHELSGRDEKNSWLSPDSILGLMCGKHECYLCATQDPPPPLNET